MSAELSVLFRCQHCGRKSGDPQPLSLPFRWGEVTALRRDLGSRGWVLKHPGDGTGPKDYCAKCVKKLGLASPAPKRKPKGGE